MGARQSFSVGELGFERITPRHLFAVAVGVGLVEILVATEAETWMYVE
jgi:hypothetical protein